MQSSLPASAEEGSTVAAAQSSTTCEVFLVRHGERLDEVPDPKIKNDRPWWDPPLTTNGAQQAAAAGEQLRVEHERTPFSVVLASPCVRTIQTASHIAAALKLPVALVPGLACAAAVEQLGLPSFDPS